jgi:hypothetical protein
MAETFKPGITDTLTSAGAVAFKRFVKGDGSQCGAGERAYGASMHEVTSAGEPLGAMVTGIALVEASATVTAGQEIESDADGKGIPLNTGKSNGVAGNSCSAGQDIRVAIR